jgi:hypothetical protein
MRRKRREAKLYLHKKRYGFVRVMADITPPGSGTYYYLQV